MINLSTINLSSSDHIVINSNLRASFSADVEFITINLVDVVWLTKITVYEFWLLQFLDPDQYAILEPNLPPSTITKLNSQMKWDAANLTVISPINLSVSALFPSLSVLMNNLNRALNVVFIDPLWLADATTAWYKSSCDGIEWTPAKPYIPDSLDKEITNIDKQYNIDCDQSIVFGKTHMDWNPSFLEKLHYKGVQTPTFNKISDSQNITGLQTDEKNLIVAPVNMDDPAQKFEPTNVVIDSNPGQQRLLWPFLLIILVVVGLTLNLLIKCIITQSRKPKTIEETNKELDTIASSPDELINLASAENASQFNMVVKKMRDRTNLTSPLPAK